MEEGEHRMRILHTADWHFGRTLEGRSRLEEQAAFVDELVQITEEQQIDLILLAGDIYDSVNPPAGAEQLFYEAMARLSAGGSRPIAVIAGNHDQPERLAASSPLVARAGITIAGLPTGDVMRFAAPRTGERAVVAALPYPSEARLAELLTGEDADESGIRSAYSARVGRLLRQQAQQFAKDTVNVAMSHIYVLGGVESDSERPIQVGGAYTVDTAALAIGAQYTALGHLHRPQTVKGDGVIRYSGSPLAYSFSEAGQAKSITILDIAPGQAASPQEIFLSSGRPLVRWQARGGMEEVYRWLDEGRDARAWIDLEIRLTEAMTMEQIQHLRKAHEGIVNIRPIYPEMESSDLLLSNRSEMPIDELFRRFYERQTGGAEPNSELVQLFLELIHHSHPVENGGETA